MLLVLYSSAWLSNVLLYGYNTFCLSVHRLVSIWVVSVFCCYKHLCTNFWPITHFLRIIMIVSQQTPVLGFTMCKALFVNIKSLAHHNSAPEYCCDPGVSKWQSSYSALLLFSLDTTRTVPAKAQCFNWDNEWCLFQVKGSHTDIQQLSSEMQFPPKWLKCHKHLAEIWQVPRGSYLC